MSDEHKYKDFERDALFNIMSETEKLANVGGWEWDLAKDELTFSDNWLRIHGCSKRHLTTAELFPIAHPDDRVDIQKAFDKAVNQGVNFEIEHRIIRQDTNEERFIRACGSAKQNSEGKTVKLYGSAQDITGRKQTENELRDSEERFKQALKHSTIVVSKQDRNLKYTWIHNSQSGFSREHILGKTDIDLLTKEESAILTAIKQGVIKNKVGSQSEVKTTINGRTYSHKLSVEPQRDAEGKVIGIISAMTDITENKKMEEKLRKHNYNLAKAQELGKIGTWELDLTNNILVWTDENCRIFGVPEGSIVDYETFINKVHPDDRDYVDREWKAGIEGKPYDIEHRLLLNGEVKWVREKADLEFDDNGKAVNAIGFTQDITALKQSAEELNRIFELSPDLIGFGNITKGYYTRVNPAYEIFGRPTDEFLSRPFRDFIHPEDLNATATTVKTMLSGQSISGFVNRYRCKDGSYRTIEWRATEAQTDGSVCVAGRDITDRMKRREEKEKLEKQLQKAQRMESIGNLAGGIAHDFNNILSSILGFTELALDEIEKGTTTEESLQEVYTAGIRAKDLVKQILAFARQSEERTGPLQPSTIAMEVLGFIRPTIPTTIEIRQEIERDAFIMGNATQVHQVLMNLCTNAAYAMDESGGVLSVSLKTVGLEKHDLVIGMKPGDYVEIKVSDTGVGIAPDILDSIFEPYFTTKSSGEGAGMGLAMVQGVIESYGGKITVDSQVGIGTTFSIYLPVTKKQSIQGAYIPEQLPTGKEHILFVDDEAPIANMGGQILERLGYSVTTRTSSIEALELFREKRDEFDVVITDMTMPNMTGDKLAIELMKIRTDIPVILCTGFSKRISEESATDIGIKAFAYKPIVKADLARTVREVLDDAKA